ncbi:N-acetylaspartate synthetase isoform X2 [Rhinatrema bivittatum]|uniref:N-acetylaspartate synthetase isoform X2 n=1 Tax=Rhinatrema bivittatum TaxID=194408 RepID=UPI00112E7AF4|nr:N-acetylaspartate synthetase isoform X2 [Rhinatrema bivittatum]
MYCLSPKMVCETKIVADDHDSIPGAKKDSRLVSSVQMWPSLSSPATSLSSLSATVEEDERDEHVYIREFHPVNQETACRIFYEVMCFVVTKSLLLTCCLPILVMGLRYYYSRKVILSYLDFALHTDMSDIEHYYMKPPGSCFWVAVLDGNVVGIVAARGNEEDNAIELRRMSVDSNYRGKGIAKALGRKVVEFAILNNYSSVVLGTTAVKMAAHKLYESLGFRHMGIIENYTLPGMTRSLLESMFFQLRYHRYRLQLREE